MKRICIFGAGAIGGHIAARLAQAGLDISVVARGEHLAAIQARGLRFVSDEEDFTVKLAASADARDLGPQDLVIAATKAHSLPAVVDAMQPLLGPDTPVVFAINGVPWWYFHGLPMHEGDLPPDQRLPRLDPAGRLWHGLGVDRAIGCVVTSPNQLLGPGVVRNNLSTNSFVFGEPTGGISARLARIAESFAPALPGFATTEHIRSLIWSKLALNVASSPLACLTQSPVADFAGDAELIALLRRLMSETVQVAAGLGVPTQIDPDASVARLSRARHPPSMLQDLLAGRPLEIDGQLRAVQDLARQAGVATPTLDVLLPLLAQRARFVVPS